MAAPYIPNQDEALDSWATNFDTLITATPTAYGLTSGLATAFNSLRTAYTSALATAVSPPTRTKSNVAAKNTAKSALIFNARSLAALVQAHPGITAEQLEDLGLTVRKTTPTPIEAPTTSPIITPLNSNAQKINFRFADEETPSSRAKPFGVAGMELWAKVGTTPPASIADCEFRGLYTKNTEGPGSRQVSVAFDGADVGKTAYMYAVWYNRRGQVGPSSPLAQMTIAA